MTLPVLVLALLVAAPLTAAESPKPAEGTVSGRVTDPSGAPVIATVTYHSDTARYASDTRTSSDGSYIITIPSGPGRLHFSASGFESRSVSVEGDGTAKTLDVTLRELPGPTAVLEGRVVDDRGNPVPGAFVTLSPMYYGYGYAESGGSGATAPAYDPYCCYGGGDDRYQTRTATTDATGSYRITHYAGTHHLSVSASNHATTTRTVTLQDGQTVTEDVTLKVVPAESVTLRGVIRDASTGEPVKGARVQVYSIQWGKWYPEVVTDATGAYSVQVLPGYTRLSAYAWKYEAPAYDTPTASSDGMVAPDQGASKPADWRYVEGAAKNYYPTSAHLDTREGQTLTRDLSLTPRPEPSIALVGYVVDEAAGKGLAGITVTVSNLQTGEWGSAVTDAAGSYRILVNPGYLMVSVYTPGYFERADHLPVPAGARELRHDLLLTAGEVTHIGGGWYGGYERAYDTPMAGGKTGYAAPGAPATTDSATREGGMTQPPGGQVAQNRQTGAAYSGGGGGLPPYSGPAPASGSNAPAGGDRAVPAPAALLALGVLALAALARRRAQ